MTTSRIGFLLVLALVVSACNGSSANDAGNAKDSSACDEPIDCPDSGVVDCMPQVGAPPPGLCACTDKAVAACPGLVFAL